MKDGPSGAATRVPRSDFFSGWPKSVLSLLFFGGGERVVSKPREHFLHFLLYKIQSAPL